MESDKVAGLEDRLISARLAAQRRRRRLQVPCLGGALVLLIATVASPLLVKYGYLPVGVEGFGQLSATAGVVLLFLMLLPTQETAIRYVTLVSGVLSAISVVIASPNKLPVVFGSDDGLASYGDLPGWFVRCDEAFTVFLLGFLGARLLYVWWAKMPPRYRLEAVWRTLGYTAIPSIFWLAVRAITGYGDRGAVSTILSITNAIGLVVLGFSPRLRSKIQARIAERGEQATAALVVGGLLGSRPLTELLNLSREKFRCVSLGVVTKEMIEENKPNPELYALTEHATLGCVDAFVSHSWCDNPHEKWEALQDWRYKFKEAKGREPRVWFDKFSIDQRNIADSLAGLPIYLAGCNNLLVLMGSTYVTRLWCLIEIFAFIVMGGERAHLEVKTLPSCKNGFSSLDVNKATCHVPEDRSRLLGIIEAGLGSLETFNSQAHKLGSQCDSLKNLPSEAEPIPVGKGYGSQSFDNLEEGEEIDVFSI